MRPAPIAEAANTRRGSKRSARPSTAETSAPMTKPACTPLDSAACLNGVSVVSRSMSGSTAAETNQSDIAATSARSSSTRERVFMVKPRGCGRIRSLQNRPAPTFLRQQPAR